MAITTGYVDIKSADGGIFQAYLARPVDAAKAPGLLLIQEVFGVNAHIRAVADDFAQQGFVVLAPDVFWRAQRNVELGYDQDSIKQAMALRAQISPEQMVADLRDAVAALKALPVCNGRIAAVGYCMGGHLVYRLAATGALDVGISYYGARLLDILDLAPQIRVPIMFHYGELDKGIPLSEVDAVRAAFANQSNATIHVYAGADHGFNCDQRGSYNADVAKIARERSLQFLRASL
jgi:carboxymethylenebutenolidase